MRGRINISASPQFILFSFCSLLSDGCFLAKYGITTTHFLLCQDIVNDLERSAKDGNLVKFETMLSLLRAPLAESGALSQGELDLVKEGGIKVWNICVEMNGKKSWTRELEAKARQVACDCLSIVASSSDDLSIHQLRLQFFARTGQVWSDLEIFDMADKCWDTAVQVPLIYHPSSASITFANRDGILFPKT